MNRSSDCLTVLVHLFDGWQRFFSSIFFFHHPTRSVSLLYSFRINTFSLDFYTRLIVRLNRFVLWFVSNYIIYFIRWIVMILLQMQLWKKFKSKMGKNIIRRNCVRYCGLLNNVLWILFKLLLVQNSHRHSTVRNSKIFFIPFRHL